MTLGDAFVKLDIFCHAAASDGIAKQKLGATAHETTYFLRRHEGQVAERRGRD